MDVGEKLVDQLFGQSLKTMYLSDNFLLFELSHSTPGTQLTHDQVPKWIIKCFKPTKCFLNQSKYVALPMQLGDPVIGLSDISSSLDAYITKIELYQLDQILVYRQNKLKLLAERSQDYTNFQPSKLWPLLSLTLET